VAVSDVDLLLIEAQATDVGSSFERLCRAVIEQRTSRASLGIKISAEACLCACRLDL